MGKLAASAVLPQLRSYSPAGLSTRTSLSLFGTSLVVALAYYLGCLAGFALRFPSSGIAYIWPANAVLVAALILSKPRGWPVILAVTSVAHGIAHAQDGLQMATWLWQFAANALQAVLAAGIVLRFSDRPRRYTTLRSVIVFIGGAALLAPAIASLIPAYVYEKMGWVSDYWSAWGMRTLTNVVTTVTLVPPLVSLCDQDRPALGRVIRRRVPEFMLLLLGLGAVHVGAFALPGTVYGGLPLALCASMPFLVWAPARFGPAGLSISLLVVAYLSINPLVVHAAPAGASPVELIVGVQMFVSIVVSPFMLLSSALEESRQSRRTEQALYSSQARSAAILRAIPDLMFVLSKDDHRYLDYYCANPGDLLVPPDRFLGKPMRDVIPPDLAARFQDAFAQAAATGEPSVFDYSLTVNHEQRFFEARVVTFEDDKLLSIVREITEERRAEAALQQAGQALARMGRASALGELAASIAHEVRQPLTAIGTNAAVCQRWLEQDAVDSPPFAEALAAIVDEVARANDVIRRTRELFTSGVSEVVPVELNSVIVEVLALARGRAERDGRTVRTELARAPLVAVGDRLQLQQVLLNLVINGLEAMRAVPGGTGPLVVRSWLDGAFVHVAVRDAGPGFDRADIDRIFEPFYTTKAEGLGMGLTISRSIIHAHGGKLLVTPNPEGGATFEFTVPAAPRMPAGPPASTARRWPTSNQGSYEAEAE